MKSLIKQLLINSPIYIPLAKYHNYSAKNEFKELLRQCENWSMEQTLEWQLQRAKQVVDYAFENVAFYNKLYSSVGFQKGDIKSWDDFHRLPLISKSDIKKDLAAFTSPHVATLNAHIGHTGGSTDKPMEFYLDKSTEIRELAFFEYYWSKNGYNFGDKCVLLRGHHIANLNRAKYTLRDNTQHYLVCDSRYLSDANAVKAIIRDINLFGAKVLQAYPSSAYLFAKSIIALGLEAPHFDYIFLGSENTYDNQIEVIKDVFSAKDVLYHYGHSECAAIAIKYPEHKEMGFCPVYGVTEFINTESSENPEIVATGWNLSTPFIRYKTGDFAEMSDYKQDDYMQNYQSVGRIEGRRHEYIITRDFRKISLCNLAGAHCTSFSLIGDMQFEQNEVGEIIVYITPPFEDAIVEEHTISLLKTDICKTFATDMVVDIRVVDQLRKTPTGKKILLFQHLDPDKY